jgi:hypothetical protein
MSGGNPEGNERMPVINGGNGGDLIFGGDRF